MADIPKSPFTVNMAHVVRGREYPPVDWLITDLFAKGDQILLAGATGLGKSLVSLLLAISAVTGRQFANLPIEPIKLDNQINAFYLDAEMPESVIAERLQRTHISDKEEVFLKNLFITNQVEQDYRFDLTDEESQNHLLNFTNLFGVDLAIVDNIFSVMSLKSFNDPEEYIKHLRPLLFNFRRHKTTGLFVDHLNRSEELYGNITKQIHFETIIRLTKDVDGIYELEFKKNRRIGLYDKPITFRIDQSTNIVSYVSKDGKGDIETYMRNNYEKIRSSAPSASVAIDRLVESAKRVNDEWQITEDMIKTWKHNPKRYFE